MRTNYFLIVLIMVSFFITHVDIKNNAAYAASQKKNPELLKVRNPRKVHGHGWLLLLIHLTIII